ncbi:GTP-binding protein [Echinicola sediminis]
MEKTKLIIIGGFLGAGKTTLLKTAAAMLQQQGRTVGLITNDQAEGLVDTLVLSNDGFAVKEIAGSCFCCNFDGLMDAALYLRDAGCDTIIAEPVGSCTDLSATLVQPIKAYHYQDFELVPLTVLIDPLRFQEQLTSEEGLKEGSGYIYLKQLEEADYLVFNKTDLLVEKDRAELSGMVKEKFPEFPVHWISAQSGQGMEEWLKDLFEDERIGTRIAQVDYDIYAEGEARMGWYNAEFLVYRSNGGLVPWAEFNVGILQLLQGVFQAEGIIIGHLKSFLKSGFSELYANLVGTNRELSIKGHPFSSASASLVINIRAEVAPELLNEIMEDVISVSAEQGLQFEKKTLKHLKPGRPEPTYRIQENQ